ncbi:MAG: hypothetical protein RIB43_13820, partial [Rhodospirillaceae bacterium]
KVPWDETPEDFSKFSDSDLVLRIRRIDAKIAQNKIIERIPGGKLFGRVFKPSSGLENIHLKAIRDAHVAECNARASCSYTPMYGADE